MCSNGKTQECKITLDSELKSSKMGRMFCGCSFFSFLFWNFTYFSFVVYVYRSQHPAERAMKLRSPGVRTLKGAACSRGGYSHQLFRSHRGSQL